MNNLSFNNNFIRKNVKLPVYEHRSKGLIAPQVKQYTKEQYEKNKISLYEYKEVSLLNPNSENSNTPKYAGYEIPPIGLVAPDETKRTYMGGVYEYPPYGQL